MKIFFFCVFLAQMKYLPIFPHSTKIVCTYIILYRAQRIWTHIFNSIKYFSRFFFLSDSNWGLSLAIAANLHVPYRIELDIGSILNGIKFDDKFNKGEWKVLWKYFVTVIILGSWKFCDCRFAMRRISFTAKYAKLCWYLLWWIMSVMEW